MKGDPYKGIIRTNSFKVFVGKKKNGSKDRESEWYQISPQRYWKLRDNEALPWKYKGNFSKKKNNNNNNNNKIKINKTHYWDLE